MEKIGGGRGGGGGEGGERERERELSVTLAETGLLRKLFCIRATCAAITLRCEVRGLGSKPPRRPIGKPAFSGRDVLVT